jgi:hypothetical protein
LQNIKLDELLQCLKGVLLPSQPAVWDAALAQCYRIFYTDLKKPHIAQTYISQMYADESRITALIAIGQLRDAFKAAIKCSDKVHQVLRVRAAALETDKQNTLTKCDAWLQRHAPETLQ